MSKKKRKRKSTVKLKASQMARECRRILREHETELQLKMARRFIA